jgi:alkanesulfonate monooxygenase SsuD/methylene tetrahydromethanopterin reductase-like flavin-dependent oxidoreductase (luciferase family)
MGNPLEQLPDIVATIRQAADEAGRGDEHFDVGFHSGVIHVGTPPDGADGRPLVAGSPEQVCESLRRATAAGANVLHVRFFNRSLSELLDQMEAFGRDVAPGLV